MAEDVAAETPKLRFNHPWFVAVWPGMGNVAMNAGVYLLAKLGMNVFGEMDTRGSFDIEQVETSDGLILPLRHPQNRLFAWTDPQGKHDLIVFIGEAQPPLGKHAFCSQLIELARRFNAERVFTFAAMATEMTPSEPSRVFCATTDGSLLDELKRHRLEMLRSGRIGGLNGLLPAVAAEASLPGICLLGEMPHVFSQLSYPKASLSILEAFCSVTGMSVDLSELEQQAEAVDQRLAPLWDQLQEAVRRARKPDEESESAVIPSPEEEGIDPQENQRLELLFEQAGKDRTKAFELKQELDRLGVFKDYEDRFLDLFKHPQ
ncbi:MAG: PAC2 family protein [Planctomycetia bacterium]|nr:PAC2 family protein [Planctomycetia bacterium]